LIGRYSNDIRTGQSRLLFAFTRLILLNGQSFNLSGFEGSDAQGQAGIGGEVDNHFLKIYGASLAIGALSDQVTRQQAVPQGAFATSSATGQIMVQTTREILQRGRESAPTITVARGSLINVEVRQDLVFHGGSLQRCA
jgi:type IV secretion system protein VirB10